MGIARQIGQHGLWPAERALRIDDPFGSPQRCQIRRERLRVGESGMLAEELQAVGPVCGEQLLQEQPSEQAREHADRQEEAGPARDPLVAVERDAAARHDHVHVRVMGHGRAPTVQHGGDADASAEVPGIGGDRGQGLGRLNSLIPAKNSLFLVIFSLLICVGNYAKSDCGAAVSCYEIDLRSPEIAKFPVIFPVSRELQVETGSYLTTHTAISPAGTKNPKI